MEKNIRSKVGEWEEKRKKWWKKGEKLAINESLDPFFYLSSISFLSSPSFPSLIYFFSLIDLSIPMQVCIHAPAASALIRSPVRGTRRYRGIHLLSLSSSLFLSLSLSLSHSHTYTLSLLAFLSVMFLEVLTSFHSLALSLSTHVGSYGHYEQDAKTYAAWGMDYIKMDW